MSVYTLKDKHVICKDGFVSTCPFTPALAIPRVSPNDNKNSKSYIPFDRVRFPCSLTCKLLETAEHQMADGYKETRIRTTCIQNAEWQVLEPEKIIEPEVVETTEVTGNEKPIKETIHLKPK
jgi:hypothetical protein